MILAFAAHPDDLEISVGGTLAKLSRKGYEVLGIIVTVPYNKEKRIKEAEKGAKILGIDIEILDFDPNELIFRRKLVKEFDRIINQTNPEIIFTHWIHDSHQDHESVSKATIASARKNNASLYMYEQTIPGGITPFAFRPQMFVDITDVIDIKINSTLAHESEVSKIGKEKWIEGILGRCMYRGRQINVKYAECFEVVKEIKRV